MSAAARDVFDIAPVNPALEDRKVPQIYQAMVAIMRDVTAIAKSSRNQQQGFNFRGIDSVYNAMHEIMAAHGVFTTSEVLAKSREERTNAKGTVLAFVSLTMKYRFHTLDGSYVDSIVEGEGMDSGDKATNKAMAIAHKYCLLQAFLVPTEEQKDPDAESHEVAARRTVRVLPPPPEPVEPVRSAPTLTPEQKAEAVAALRKAISTSDDLEGLRDATRAALNFAKTHNDKALHEDFKSQSADVSLLIKERQNSQSGYETLLNRAKEQDETTA